MYLVKTPYFVKCLLPYVTWNIQSEDQTIYLTFDDGPIPEVTPWVLNTLKDFDAKATFFCVGENIHKHKELFKRITEEGHTTGSHTYNHLNGWQTDNNEYFHNVREASLLAQSTLFRPPYGKLKPRQAQFLDRRYQIIMWDVLSGDFDTTIEPEQVYQNVIRHSTNGSIVVFHDSLKAWKNLEYALPKSLEYLSSLGYKFKSLTREVLDFNHGGLQPAHVI